MYLTHFGFTEPPFKTLLFQASKQRGYINYFAGVELMLAHACNDSDSIGLFGEDDIIISELLNRVQMKSETPGALIEVNNNLSAKEFDKKLADCLSFTDENITREPRYLLVLHVRDNFTLVHKRILRKHLDKARDRGADITLLLAGNQSLAETLKTPPAILAAITTPVTLRAPHYPEVRGWFLYQHQWNGRETSLFSDWQIRQIYSRCHGQLSLIGKVADMALLAAFAERSARIKPRHLRGALKELTLEKRHYTPGIAASVLWLGAFIATGWQVLPHTSPLLPIPASWAQQPPAPASKPLDKIEDALDQPVAAMRQLFRVWGYDVPLEEAFCEEAGRAKLQCKRGESPVSTLEKNGYPWLAELRVGDRTGYASVVRSGPNDMDLLMGNKTWQVSRDWFKHAATGNYVLLYRLTPQGNTKVDAKSDPSEIAWLNKMLSRALMKPKNTAPGWSAALVDNIKEFQRKMAIKVDGQIGESTLMRLLIASGESPGLIRDKDASANTQQMQKVQTQESKPQDAATELAAVAVKQ